MWVAEGQYQVTNALQSVKYNDILTFSTSPLRLDFWHRVVGGAGEGGVCVVWCMEQVSVCMMKTKIHEITIKGREGKTSR